METTKVNDTGTDIILEYVFKESSWKKLYFSKLTSLQKILFFLPVPFLYLPIYGTYDLYHRDSWTLFLSFGVVNLVAIWIFYKQKSYLEQKVFEKHYLSNSCKTILDYQLEKLSFLLGEQNTVGNRTLWKTFFEKKNKLKPPPLSLIFSVVYGIIYFHFLTKPHAKENLWIFAVGFISLLILLMTFAFIYPAFSDYKSKAAACNEAFRLISELDKKMTKK